MAREYLGKGWKFPIALDDSHTDLRLAQYEASIRDAIGIILDTAPGERLMRPNFGCGIHNLVFATFSASTAGRIQSAVKDALKQWEPRINVTEVRVTAGDKGEVLYIYIAYTIRATNNELNLVYPFYLQGGA